MSLFYFFSLAFGAPVSPITFQLTLLLCSPSYPVCATSMSVDQEPTRSRATRTSRTASLWSASASSYSTRLEVSIYTVLFVGVCCVCVCVCVCVCLWSFLILLNPQRVPLFAPPHAQAREMTVSSAAVETITLPVAQATTHSARAEATTSSREDQVGNAGVTETRQRHARTNAYVYTLTLSCFSLPTSLSLSLSLSFARALELSRTRPHRDLCRERRRGIRVPCVRRCNGHRLSKQAAHR